jgi:hypothetical protein
MIIYMCVCVCVCVYIYIYIYIYMDIYFLDHSYLHVLCFYAYDVFSMCCDKCMILIYKMTFNVINGNLILG